MASKRPETRAVATGSTWVTTRPDIFWPEPADDDQETSATWHDDFLVVFKAEYSRHHPFQIPQSDVVSSGSFPADNWHETSRAAQQHNVWLRDNGHRRTLRPDAEGEDISGDPRGSQWVSNAPSSSARRSIPNQPASDQHYLASLSPGEVSYRMVNYRLAGKVLVLAGKLIDAIIAAAGTAKLQFKIGIACDPTARWALYGSQWRNMIVFHKCESSGATFLEAGLIMRYKDAGVGCTNVGDGGEGISHDNPTKVFTNVVVRDVQWKGETPS